MPDAAWSELGEWGDLQTLELLEAAGRSLSAWCRSVPARGRSGLSSSPGRPPAGLATPGSGRCCRTSPIRSGLPRPTNASRGRTPSSCRPNARPRRPCGQPRRAFGGSPARVRCCSSRSTVTASATSWTAACSPSSGTSPACSSGGASSPSTRTTRSCWSSAGASLDGEEIKGVPVPLEGHDLEAWAHPAAHTSRRAGRGGGDHRRRVGPCRRRARGAGRRPPAVGPRRARLRRHSRDGPGRIAPLRQPGRAPAVGRGRERRRLARRPLARPSR